MKFTEDPKNRVVAAAIDDVVRFEGAELIFNDARGAVARMPQGNCKCAFACVDDFYACAESLGLQNRDVCVMNMPFDFGDEPCVTFAYFEPMPPTLRGLDIRRLAPTLAGEVARAYRNKSGGYGADETAALMRDKGVFGALVDGNLAGFIGRHRDGNMGMLEVRSEFRRRGIGEELQKFLIGYIMTFGRIPICDVYADNAPSLALQEKLGLTRADNYTFWLTGKQL